MAIEAIVEYTSVGHGALRKQAEDLGLQIADVFLADGAATSDLGHQSSESGPRAKARHVVSVFARLCRSRRMSACYLPHYQVYTSSRNRTTIHSNAVAMNWRGV